MVLPKFNFITEEETSTFGRFSLEPLEIGFGNTLGTALRRVLYNSVSGSAITEIKIDGARHQFTTVPGVKEDMVDLILNIKQIRVRFGGQDSATLRLSGKGPGEIKAGDIEVSDGVEIVNPELHLATVEKASKLNIEFTVEKGLGYSPAEERKSEALGVIPIDAKFTPVVMVNYTVSATRVGRVTNFDKLVLEVTTDGTISPSEAIKEAAETLVKFFGQIISPQVMEEERAEVGGGNSDVIKLTVEELDLPTRIANALRKGGFETVADLLSSSRKEIAKVKNLGSKSVKIVEAALKEKGVELSQ